jgi:hypothetical protein
MDVAVLLLHLLARATFFAMGDMVVVVVVHKGGDAPPRTTITNTNI